MIITLAVRVLQIIFAAVVLALSVVLVHGYGPGHAPSLFDYGAFCGAAAGVVGAVGIVACFIDPLQGVIMLALDGLSTLFLLAGGIAFAATLKVGNCTNEFYLADHQKTFFASDQKYAFLSTKQAENDVISRCRMSQADTALIWFTLACAAGAVALSFMSHKSGRGSIV